jgi:hypothetical protein
VNDNPYQAPQSRLESDDDDAADRPPEEVEVVPHHEYDPTGLLFAEAARRSGVQIDALRFVFDADVNSRDIALDTPEGRLHGLGLSEAVVRYAEDLYGSDALKSLADWGMVNGLDVNRVWEALVASGLINTATHRSNDHAFDLASLARFSRISR